VLVDIEPCVCDPPPPAPTTVGALQVVDSSTTPSSVEISFVDANAHGEPVLSYAIRYREGTALMTEDDFSQATPAPTVAPGQPGAPESVVIQGLKPATSYVLGVRSSDDCGQGSPLAQIPFATAAMKFKQVSGCFVATAAYGSEMAPGVAALRSVRDRLVPESAIFAAATDLYYRVGPAAADVLRRSDTARALARRLLGPVAAVAAAALSTSASAR
jgi:hypothetical protein